MSMRNYATEAYGLILTIDEAFDAIKKYLAETEDPIKDGEGFWDVYNVGEMLGLIVYGNLEADTFLIDEDGSNDWSSEEHIDETAIVLEMRYYPNFFKAVYKDRDDMIAELKSSDIAKYLPEDFDYNNHLRHLVGNSWG